MSNQNQKKYTSVNTSETICFQILKGSRLILADERSKKKLLDIVLEVCTEHDQHMNAFCIMDEEAIFMIRLSSREIIHQMMDEITNRFLVRCREYLPYLEGITPYLEMCELRMTTDQKEAVEYCRKIHRLPVERGYTRRVCDYWWSSYITYMGFYDWKFIDCKYVLSYFSSDEERAKERMQAFHNRRKSEIITS